MTSARERYTLHTSVAILWVLLRRDYSTRAWDLLQQLQNGLAQAAAAPGFVEAVQSSLPYSATQRDVPPDTVAETIADFLRTIRSLMQARVIVELPQDVLDRVSTQFAYVFEALPPALRLSPYDRASAIASLLRRAPLIFADPELREPFTRVAERIDQRAEQYGLPVRFTPFWIGD